MEKIIIYGAGERGIGLFELFESYNISDKIFGFCDMKAEEIKQIGDRKVYLYDHAKTFNLPFLISFIDEEQVELTKNMLSKNGSEIVEINDISDWFGYNDSVEFNRMLCAYLHKKSMNSYFESSEKNLDVF